RFTAHVAEQRLCLRIPSAHRTSPNISSRSRNYRQYLGHNLDLFPHPVRGQMSTEHLLREFYNQMYRVHTQPGNAYDLGDHLHHLTVHKHLDQDPLIQFREAYRWVDQAGARLVADAGCGYGGFAVFAARQAPTLSVDGYTLSDVQRAVAGQALARLHLSKSRALLKSYDRLERQYDAIVAIESLGHSANVAATLHHWASHLRPGGVVVIIDERFRPEVSPANP